MIQTAALAVASCLLVNTALATNYYVDPAGNDGNSGTSSSSPWQSLTKASTVTFTAGDRLYLRSGATWNGQQLTLQGGGASGNPVIVDQYAPSGSAGGARPIINGPGTPASAGVLLNSPGSYWEINNLEITNTQPVGQNAQVVGIWVNPGVQDVVTHIYIQNCNIHDINGQADNKGAGGIIFWWGVTDVLIANCTISNVTTEGIRAGGIKAGVPSNIVVRDNLLENIYGDGIVVRPSSGGSRIENNVLYNSCYNTNGNNYAGAWTYDSTGTIIQQNEVYGQTGGGGNDGQAFDADIGTRGDIFQYNYSHDNARGFMLLMNDAQNIIVRYNISQNDSLGSSSWGGHRLIAQQNGGNATALCQIYNNVFYSTTALDNVFANGGKMKFDNNLLVLTQGASKFSSVPLSSSSTFRNNVFFPGSITAVNGPVGTVSNNLTSDPMLMAPGTGGTGIVMGPNGFAVSQTGYHLAAGSPALGAGLLVSNNGGLDYWGGPVSSTAAPNIGPYNGLSLGTTADSYVQDGTNNVNVNHGTETTMLVKSDAPGYNRHAYITFDTSAAASVGSAVINLYVTSTGNSASRTITVYPEPTTNWGETNINWTNAPAPGSPAIGTFNISNTAGIWYSLDVTSYVQAQRAAGHNVVSFELINNGAADGNGLVSFATKEATAGKPTLTITPDNEVWLGTTADSYVQDGSGNNTVNHGTETTMLMKSDAAGYNRRTFMTFNTSAASSVNKALINLYVTSTGSAVSRTVTVYAQPTTNWGETSITWNNAPAPGNELGAFVVPNSAGVWYTFDVTSYVQAQRAAGNNVVSFELIDNSGADSGSLVSFATKEASTGDPLLVITR